MAPSLVKAGEKQKAPPVIEQGGALLNWIDLQVYQLAR